MGQTPSPLPLTGVRAAERAAPARSPDGEHLAFESSRHGNRKIHVMASPGKNPIRPTHHAAVDEFPSWSPDGSQIVFASSRTGNFDIFVVDLETREQRHLTHHSAQDSRPSWSPDGKRIAFGPNRDGADWDIYVMRPDGDSIGAGMMNALAPDGAGDAPRTTTPRTRGRN